MQICIQHSLDSQMLENVHISKEKVKWIKVSNRKEFRCFCIAGGGGGGVGSAVAVGVCFDGLLYGCFTNDKV